MKRVLSVVLVFFHRPAAGLHSRYSAGWATPAPGAIRSRQGWRAVFTRPLSRNRLEARTAPFECSQGFPFGGRIEHKRPDERSALSRGAFAYAISLLLAGNETRTDTLFRISKQPLEVGLGDGDAQFDRGNLPFLPLGAC